eukprot:2943825-Rhodomonas_salina.2
MGVLADLKRSNPPNRSKLGFGVSGTVVVPYRFWVGGSTLCPTPSGTRPANRLTCLTKRAVLCCSERLLSGLVRGGCREGGQGAWVGARLYSRLNSALGVQRLTVGEVRAGGGTQTMKKGGKTKTVVREVEEIPKPLLRFAKGPTDLRRVHWTCDVSDVKLWMRGAPHLDVGH